MTQPNMVAAGVILSLLVSVLFWIILRLRVEATGCAVVASLASIYGLNQVRIDDMGLNNFAGWTFIGVPIILAIASIGLAIQRWRSHR